MSGLLIVDDEEIVRRTVAHVVAGSVVALNPIYEASSGDEAVALARQVQPGVVLMDLRMPGLDGLAAARQIRTEEPSARVIILTAYDEFPLVQEALSMGVYDYLLKPIRPAALLDVLARAHTELEHAASAGLERAETRARLAALQPLAEARLAREMVGRAVPDADAAAALQALGRRLERPAVFVIRVDERCADPDATTGCLPAALPGLLRPVLPDGRAALLAQTGPATVLALLSTGERLASPDELRNLGQAMRYALKMGGLDRCFSGCARYDTPINVTVGIAGPEAALSALPAAYERALGALRYSLYGGRDAVFYAAEPAVSEDASLDAAAAYPLDLERQLLAHLRQDNRLAAQEAIDHLVDALLQARPDPAALLQRLAELAALIGRAAIDGGAAPGPVLALTQRQAQALNALASPDDVRSWAAATLKGCVGQCPAGEPGDHVVERAIEYMAQNRERPDLGLDEVARMVHLSPSHLRHLFKARLGTSYVKYLTSLRIEEARRLLRTTTMTVDAVAVAVGYTDPAYFHRVFRREAGTTPSAYRSGGGDAEGQRS